jgi:hypothetical protein
MSPAMLRRALACALLAAACSRPPAGSGPAPTPLPPSAAAREVRLSSTPAAAEVVIGGQARCATPCVLRLDPGVYRVLVRKVGFLPVESDLVVDAARDASLDLSLVSSH